MFTALRNKLKDVSALAQLCREAERESRLRGQAEPGSEDFVLASLAMSDGAAERVFTSLGITAAGFRDALQTQFEDALAHAGVAVSAGAGHPAPAAAPPPARLYRAAPSGQALVQRLAAAADGGHRADLLLSARVLLAVADEEFSVAARAFRVLGITRPQLAAAAADEIAASAQ